MQWKGVMPAITTAFDADLMVDAAAVEKHCRWMIESGCTAIIALGSLGEGATLSYDEKLDVVSACIRAVGKKVPVVAAISALSTDEAARIAKAAAERGCSGLMVLPP